MRSVFLPCLATLVAVTAGPLPLPTVDLGYEVHQATYVDDGDYFAFEGIRYAEQPIGKYRFYHPVPPRARRPTTQKGLDDTKCVQAYPQWLLETDIGSKEIQADHGTESCLVLDVQVPRAGMPGLGREPDSKRYPVLVWIHGGGFTYGHKKASSAPTELLRQATKDDGEFVIVVKINYRLGMFGWMVGPGATPNLGLYDQKLALEWVQNNIARFGGDRNRITLMGEGAGAASILHHITTKSLPRPRLAIMQSPAFEVAPNHSRTWDRLESMASQRLPDDEFKLTSPQSMTKKAEEAGRDVEAVLREVNQGVVRGSEFGKYSFGPAVAGKYVSKLPQVALAEGNFDRGITVMQSHYAHEAAMFAPPNISTAADMRRAVAKARDQATPATLNAWLAQYPDVLDGTHPWRNQAERYKHMMYDLDAGCSTTYLAKAKPETYSAVFDWAPDVLGEDVPAAAGVALVTAARYFVLQLTRTGQPNGIASWLYFPQYGQDAEVMKVTSSIIARSTDDLGSARCAWVQQALAKGLL